MIIHYNSNLTWAKETQEKVNKFWFENIIIKSDLSDPVQIDDMFQQIMQEFGTIDVLINNAWSLWPYEEFADMDFVEIEKLFRINLIAPMYCAQCAVKILQSQDKEGVILNTSSVHDREFGKWSPAIPYCVSKWGLKNFNNTLAKAVAPKIRVCWVAPWPVITPIWDNDTQETKDYFVNSTMIKRWITPEEIAETFVFLAQNESITWTMFYVDGWFR